MCRIGKEGTKGIGLIELRDEFQYSSELIKLRLGGHMCMLMPIETETEVIRFSLSFLFYLSR